MRLRLRIHFAALGLVATASGAVAQPVGEPDRSREQRQFDKLWMQASERCSRSASFDECRFAFLAANYTEAGATSCRREATTRFDDWHGGAATTHAQREIRKICGGSMRGCRTSWRLFYDLSNRSDGGQSRQRRQEIVEQNLVMACGEEDTANSAAK